MGFKRTKRIYIRRIYQSYKRTLYGDGACADPENTNPHHSGKIDQEHRHITLAYFDKISTVDYIGAVQGIPVCFDAKECRVDTFPLQNVHEHQMNFMDKFEKQGGIAFLLIYYSTRDELYYMRYEEIRRFWDRGKNGGRKSFRYEELDPGWFMKLKQGYFVPYLDLIQKDLDCRED